MSATYKAILPKPTAETAPFWAGCNDGKLLLAHCNACGHVFHYPRIMCVRCNSRDLGWQESAGRGTVWSFTRVEVSFYGPTWDSELPYIVVVVDLDEGVRMLSRLVGEGADAVAVGDGVTLEWVEVEGQKLPFFRLGREAA